MALRQRTLGSGDEARTLWYDQRGRLMKVEIAASEVVAFRRRGG
jgi:hypothetical protein